MSEIPKKDPQAPFVPPEAVGGTRPLSFGWEGRQVRLVPLDKSAHFANAVRWLNDPRITQWTLIGDFPLTRLAEEAYFDRVCQAAPDATDITFAVELLGEIEEHIGFAGLHQIEWRHGVAQTGLLIGRAQLWRRGLGTDVMQVRTRYAFEVLGLRLLLSQVFVENVASLRALARVGYREVGRIPRRYWKRGAWRDLVLLAIAREDWRG